MPMYVFDFLKKWDDNVYDEYKQYANSLDIRDMIFSTVTNLLDFTTRFPHVTSASVVVTTGDKAYKVRLATTNAAYATMRYKP